MQDDLGVIYAANYDGIINFNGSQWRFLPIKNGLPGLSIAHDKKNRIFVGTLGDFGYLQPTLRGDLHFVTLSQFLPSNVRLTPFWHVIPTQNGVYFSSPSLTVRWTDGKLTYWSPVNNGVFRYGFHVFDNFYTTQRNQGILKIVSDTINVIPHSKSIIEHEIVMIEEHLQNSLLIGTSKNGFYFFSQGDFQDIESNAERFLIENKLLTSDKHIKSNLYALGTINGGIGIVDKELELKRVIDKARGGLITNAVRDVMFDSHDNLWSALNEGISFIELSSPWEYWNNNSKFFGIPTSILRFNNQVYVSSSEGLFLLFNQSLNKIKELDSKIWDLAASQHELIAASQEGVYVIKKKLKIQNFSESTFLSFDDSLLHIGHNNGLSVLEYSEGSWVEKYTINIPNPAYRSVTYDTDNNLWVSAKFNGIYKISNFENPQIVKYDTTYGLPDINEIQIIKKDDRLLFTTTKGFYHFNEKTERFEPDSSIISERLNINNIAEDKFGNYIISVVSEDRTAHVEMLRKEGDEYVRDYIPFRRLPEMEITAIYPDGDKYIWIGGSEGLFRFDRTVKKDYTLPFNTLVSRVSVRDSVIFYGNYYDNTDTTGVPPIILDQPDHFKPELEYKDNNLTFEYAAAFYEAPERTVYSYYLENNEPGWSKWTSDTKKEYNNLSAGTYTFHVKAKNIYDTEGRIASYEFTILPPWYQTVWAYIGFSILGVLFIWFIALLYTFRVRMQRRRLKLIVADRTYEVIQQKKEIERQKDLLQHQYEEICNQRDSIQQKNRELQVAQNETLSANEALQKLNNHLEKEVEKRTKKIKQTLQQLQNKNKELDTFIYRASHDLKGPISRISGLSTLAKMAVPPDADQNFVALIEETANNMKVLISKLTQVHDLNNAQIRKDSVRIADLVASGRHMLSHLEKDGNIEYYLNFSEDLEVSSDKDLLGIIIQNLLENALVFRKPRGVEHQIRIEITVLSEVLTIKIYDTGIGIYPEQIDRVFEMFYKGVNQSIGSGLGLYLVKMTVEKLNGTITVQSKIHEYTEFTVTLPLSDNHAN
ncbi:hypothetical protein C900_03308 [Fulvivirga imtechensis AK7]|uniref:histidine kinase n=1 Tax=Fulvivirga imtechensis AK7 TaxID=1237149 RepID=L8JRQ6_9BACT|nr:ATP-binding protein [Fulvivirga imtechensis]ELR70873.1 hypothetical protein C900_03308 [Fulvivirga imtechensis AK7]